jgi:hypothetical protein
MALNGKEVCKVMGEYFVCYKYTRDIIGKVRISADNRDVAEQRVIDDFEAGEEYFFEDEEIDGSHSIVVTHIANYYITTAEKNKVTYEYTARDGRILTITGERFIRNDCFTLLLTTLEAERILQTDKEPPFYIMAGGYGDDDYYAGITGEDLDEDTNKLWDKWAPFEIWDLDIKVHLRKVAKS